jgi:hypothetical protein
MAKFLFCQILKNLWLGKDMAVAIMIKTFESLCATLGPKKPWWGHTFCPAIIRHCSLCLWLFDSLVIVFLVQHSLRFMPFFLVCGCLFVHAILSCVQLFVCSCHSFLCAVDCLFMPFFLLYVCLFVGKVVQRSAKGTWGMRLCNGQVYIVGMQFTPWQRFWGFNLQVQPAMSFFL